MSENSGRPHRATVPFGPIGSLEVRFMGFEPATGAMKRSREALVADYGNVSVHTVDAQDLFPLDGPPREPYSVSRLEHFPEGGNWTVRNDRGNVVACPMGEDNDYWGPREAAEEWARKMNEIFT